jgi:predicted phage-related endonuclease
MKGAYNMGNRALENRIKKLKEIEQQQKELEQQAQELKEEIKADMIAKGKEEITAGGFIVRLKEVITKRFDSKSFAQNYKELYEAYTKPQSYTRFTIV